MSVYIEKQAVMKKFAEVVAPSNNSDFQKPPIWNDAVEIVANFPSADVVPWSFLERYADWFCALVQYPEFIREAKRFYLGISAMEGGVIDD